MTEAKNGAPDNAGVAIKPPVLHMLVLLIGFVCEAAWPLPVSAPGWRSVELVAGALMLIAGAGLLFICFRRFSNAGTNVPTDLPTVTLVTGGPYGFSRNPIYLGLLAVYLGIALLLDTGWLFLFAIPLLAVMEFGVIRREERYLEAKFGDAYRDYRHRVRRWI
ncbi:MAG: isoprenylcysteine carboxylmethyltransferase family protein [Parvibaculum sp.]|uniref:methyltransferase family protein n=1 Tax=Parvibaculum sp. TaxID=2024848 RepID=UPI0025DF3F98|nr:isoprenylcysteine carboxylmethyltransferase family protein [Parvibaculum sp.]MCE9648403.1 isoprenylcysteine carboxylmethyltransferase family protein [Parvibaculum sp.]